MYVCDCVQIRYIRNLFYEFCFYFSCVYNTIGSLALWIKRVGFVYVSGASNSRANYNGVRYYQYARSSYASGRGFSIGRLFLSLRAGLLRSSIATMALRLFVNGYR